MKSPANHHLDQQLCFALYSAARATQNAYRPLLAELGITYPQYLTLLALWEADGPTVGALGERLHLDSGTLSPLLRRMQQNGLVTLARAEQDARQVHVHLTAAGRRLEERVDDLQRCLAENIPLTAEEAQTLRDLAQRLVAPTS